MSSSLTIKYVSSPRLTSVPAYCWKTTLSPLLTSGTTRVPFSKVRPAPTSTTVPSLDFSLALSVNTIPLFVVCSCSVFV